jgi:hypothetical protein
MIIIISIRSSETMRVTVILRDADSWRVPVKSTTATVRWLVDEVARRHKRRREVRLSAGTSDSGGAAEASSTTTTAAGGESTTTGDVNVVREIGDIVGMRRANNAVLDLDDRLFDHCSDGGERKKKGKKKKKKKKKNFFLLPNPSDRPQTHQKFSLQCMLARGSW